MLEYLSLDILNLVGRKKRGLVTKLADADMFQSSIIFAVKSFALSVLYKVYFCRSEVMVTYKPRDERNTNCNQGIRWMLLSEVLVGTFLCDKLADLHVLNMMSFLRYDAIFSL